MIDRNFNRAAILVPAGGRVFVGWFDALPDHQMGRAAHVCDRLAGSGADCLFGALCGEAIWGSRSGESGSWRPQPQSPFRTAKVVVLSIVDPVFDSDLGAYRGKNAGGEVPHAKGPFELVEREIPEPPAGSVRIRVQACGICHSDEYAKRRQPAWHSVSAHSRDTRSPESSMRSARAFWGGRRDSGLGLAGTAVIVAIAIPAGAAILLPAAKAGRSRV